MREEDNTITVRVEELRRSFDESFANAYLGEADPHEDFIAIRVADSRYAIRLTEISGLYAGKTVTPVPGSVSGLLGVAAFRGTIIPVFELRTLLGYSGGEPPRWLVLVPVGSPVGLAFDQFERHLRVLRGVIPTDEPAEPAHDHMRQISSVDGTSRMVLHLPSILNEIKKRARRGLQKER